VRLQEWQDELKAKGLEILALTSYNTDFNHKLGFDPDTEKLIPVDATDHAKDRQVLQSYAEYHKLTFRIMGLPKVEWQHARKAYGVSMIPQFVVIDRKGVVRMVRVGKAESKLEDIDAEIRTQLKRK
jgi:hypothetical protein